MVNMAKETDKLIINIARKHFVQKGFTATRMQEIADEANINKAMLHYYFRSKEKMYEEIIIQTLNTIIPRLAKAIEHEGTLWERIEKLIETYINILIEQPDIPIFIMSELSQKQERFVKELKKRAAFFPVVQNFILQIMTEMQQGKIKEIPPIHLFLNILGMTIFPFMAKPIFCTVFDFPEKDFTALMEERKKIILEFVKAALCIA